MTTRRPVHWPKRRSHYLVAQKDPNFFEGIDYQLSFKRSRKKRKFVNADGVLNLTSEAVDNSIVGRGKVFGTFNMELYDSDPVVVGLTMALSEAIHEVMEYYKIGGYPMLNPHGFMGRFVAEPEAKKLAKKLVSAARLEYDGVRSRGA